MRRHDLETVDRVLLAVCRERLRVSRAFPRDDMNCAARGERWKDRGVAEVGGDRRHRGVNASRGKVQELEDARDVVVELPMLDGDALRRSRRPRREKHVRKVFRRDADDRGLGRLRLRRSHVAYAEGSDVGGRSEEHTSELQSRVDISYAVFCLNKKHWSELQSRVDISYAVFCLKKKKTSE